MPTGYTADVLDGKITDLRSFAMLCARGMGACITMRDDPWDKPIPEKFEPSPYYGDRLVEAECALADLHSMTPDEWEAQAEATYVAECKARDEYVARKLAGRDRYDAMIAKVSAWEGAPEGIKSFMLDQLRDARRFDCGDCSYYKEVERLSGEDWKAQREAELMQQSARAAAEWQKEKDRTASRNAWIAQLRASLDAYEASMPEAANG